MGIPAVYMQLSSWYTSKNSFGFLGSAIYREKFETPDYLKVNGYHVEQIWIKGGSLYINIQDALKKIRSEIVVNI